MMPTRPARADALQPRFEPNVREARLVRIRFWSSHEQASHRRRSRDPERRARLRRTCVPVQNLFDFSRRGDSLDVFLDQFPSMTREMAIAVREQARLSLHKVGR